jgi:NAD(P)-dependent dehydrogenase (short-subunit alcohol dehydrogenase family)
MRVLIIGASKGIGLETTRQALDAVGSIRYRDCDLKS